MKPLLTGDIKEQGRKLIATLTVVIGGLKDLNATVPAAQALAKRHVAYGVTLAHYARVGAALLWTSIDGTWRGFHCGCGRRLAGGLYRYIGCHDCSRVFVTY